MKKFFKTTTNIIKWTFRLGILGIIAFIIIKYVQATFYYEPEPNEHVSEKENYLSGIKIAQVDTLTVYDTLVEQIAVRVPVTQSQSRTGDSMAVARLDSTAMSQVARDSAQFQDSTRTVYRTKETVVERKEVLSPPNIIVIVFDDLGYGDLGAFGSKAIRTPFIDTLAAQGAKLTSFYVPAGYGTPNRASLLTGRYPFRSGMTHTLYPASSSETTYLKARDVQLGLIEDEIAMTEPLKKAGYATGLIGKWHLGDEAPHLPNAFGFDYFFGVHVSHDMEPLHLYRNSERILEHPFEPDKLIDGYTEESLKFIEQHKDEPFFLLLSHSFPHAPLFEGIGALSRSRAGLYGDVIEALDKSVGRIVESLNSYGLDQETMIIITSDNGPSYLGDNGSLRGRKYEVFEGGVRVPFIAWYPKEIPRGTINHTPAMIIDLFPTIAKKVGIDLPQDRKIDGENIWPILTTNTTQKTERSFFFFWRDQIYAVRNGNYKYHIKHRIGTFNEKYPLPNSVSQGPWLFDLSYDEAEAYNIIENEKSLADRMDQQIEDMQEEMNEDPRAWIQ